MKHFLPLFILTGLAFGQERREVVVDRYPTGVKKEVIIFEGEGTKEKIVGKVYYYDTEKLEVYAEWKNGQENGLYETYYRNGKQALLTNITRLDGFAYYSGKTTIWWYNGNKWCEGICGLKNVGVEPWIAEIEDEKEREEMIELVGAGQDYYGKVGLWKFYHLNGALDYDTTFTKNDIDFLWELEVYELIENGNKEIILEQKNSASINVFKEFMQGEWLLNEDASYIIYQNVVLVPLPSDTSVIPIQFLDSMKIEGGGYLKVPGTEDMRIDIKWQVKILDKNSVEIYWPEIDLTETLKRSPAK